MIVATRTIGLVVATMIMVASAAPAASLPPQLVARLEADRAAADAELEQQRERLAPIALKQRTATATHARIVDRGAILEGVAGMLEAELPAGIAADVDDAVAAARQALEQADEDLETATSRASTAQASALDADRRLRAIQRASATATERDTTLGSWRFGSGGPAVSAESLDRYLQSKGSPLAGEGSAFLAAGVEHEVDPRLVVAIAGAEGYFGVTTCASFNAWGWGCPTSPFTFTSWAHAIDTVTLGLREGYVDDGLTTVGQIHLRYAPPNATNDPTGLNYAWADNVARFLVEQGGDPQSVAGVLGPSR